MITMKFSCAITCFQQDGKYKVHPAYIWWQSVVGWLQRSFAYHYIYEETIKTFICYVDITNSS